MTRREWLVKIINENNFKIVAEIGCDSGWTSEFVLNNCDLDCFIMVERIIKYPLYNIFMGSEKINEWGMTQKPAVLMRMTSVAAAEIIADNSLDLVFIDADHDYASVMEDCACWEPKVRKGGIISGHDYDPKGGFDVWKVVDELYENFNLEPDDAGGPNNHVWWLRQDVEWYSGPCEVKKGEPLDA